MLHYHKCNDCLTAFTSTENKVDICDCNGEVTYMGEVHGKLYMVTEDKAPCDGRCTHASGPVCDCQCGGVNHGTGKFVQVQKVGGIVKASGLNPSDIERADKFRIARDFAENLYSTKWAPLMMKSWSEGSEARRLRRELNHILGLRVYDRRQKELLNLIIELNK